MTQSSPRIETQYLKHTRIYMHMIHSHTSNCDSIHNRTSYLGYQVYSVVISVIDAKEYSRENNLYQPVKNTSKSMRKLISLGPRSQ